MRYMNNGYLYGIGVDFWKLIAKKAKLKYKLKLVSSWSKVLEDIKEKKADLAINTTSMFDKEKYILFSKPYVSFPLAIICKDNENFNSIEDIKSISVVKNLTVDKVMKEHYPNINYIETKTTFDALKLVENKKAQCAVDILPSILWVIDKNHLMNLQIAFKTHFKLHLQIMIRNDRPDILHRINSAISQISPSEKQKIVDKYIGSIVVEKKNFDIKYLIIILAILIIIFYIFISKYKKIKKELEVDKLIK
ncbi:transporter substrate-binding domain-containing protein [Caminibacter profundus]